MELSDSDAAAARVRSAVAAIAAGRAVVVADNVDRKNEGDLIFAASLATPALVAFMVRHTSGFVGVAVADDDCDRLGLVPMSRDKRNRYQTAYQVTLDVRDNGTGISAAARAATIAALGSPGSRATDFTRPGHVVPVRARPGGVLARPGHTEAAVDLARLAGLPAAGALSTVVSQDHLGEMARGAELERFAEKHSLPLISVAELAQYRRRIEPQVHRVVETTLPTALGRFTAYGYRGAADEAEYLALTAGPVGADTPVQVHIECVAGDVLQSTGCDCRRELEDALRVFAARRSGVIIYLRLPSSLGACVLEQWSDGQPEAAYWVAEWMAADLGVNRPQHSPSLEGRTYMVRDNGSDGGRYVTRPRTQSAPADALSASRLDELLRECSS
ncbi:MAG: 3,4-dihydroxy-2-butanone-4-phosphate synthase [Hyphomicrobiales bacterium]|nr:MAG: 3,4-dihydroxy-2-butanone-4-phosphate synthase [Hyphomicrobiales bacterium]